MLISTRNTHSGIHMAVLSMAALLALLVLPSQALTAPQCAQFRYDAQHTGRSCASATYNPTLSWTCNAGVASGASVVIGSNGTAYYTGNDDNLYAVSSTGAVSWHYSIGTAVNGSPAIGADGTIYCAATSGKLYAVTSTGTSKWANPFSFGSTSTSMSLLIDNAGTIYFGASNDQIFAVNPDGTQKWSYGAQGYALQILAMSPDQSTIYASGSDGKIYAIGSDGVLKWKNSSVSPTTSCAVGDDGTIYVGGQSAFYALNSNGSLKWSYTLDGRVTSDAAVGKDGSVYFGDVDAMMYALNPNGTKKWTYASSGAIYSAPTLDPSGVLLFGSYSGALVALNAVTGSFDWSRQVDTRIYASPVVGSDGGIFVTDTTGKISKYTGPVPAPISPEPSSMLVLSSALACSIGAMRLRRRNRS